MILSKQQAKQFILIKQGLIGEYKFRGKEGVREFVRQAGCIQFDPIDVCGKNPELVLQSRVEGFTKEMLYALLYEDRYLLDYFDKNLAIVDIEDWKYFERIRESYRIQSRGREEVDAVAETIQSMIRERGPLSSKDIGMDQKIDWYWSDTKLSRAALETLYFRGDLIVHHKKGTVKYYALAEDYIPEQIRTAKDPFERDQEHIKWRVLRRISAVGMMWNKASDAWLYIHNLKSKERSLVFDELLEDDKILEFGVEGVKEKLYCLSKDRWILEKVLEKPSLIPRTELIAPLDSMIWDRKLIKAIFDFAYKWEIYTPISERKYGYYVLPILSGEEFIGRVEAVCDKKQDRLIVKNIWLEQDTKITEEMVLELQSCFQRFTEFHGLNQVAYSDDVIKVFGKS